MIGLLPILVRRNILDSLQNEARNFAIQSSSSDLLLWCAMDSEKDLLQKWNTKIVNLIHDSMLLEIPADPKTVAEVGRYCYKKMTEAPMKLFGIDLPFKADYEIGKNWSELVEFKLDEESEKNNLQIMIEEGQDEGKLLSWDDWYGGK